MTASSSAPSCRRQLKADPLVKESIYETKEQAYERFKEMYEDAPDLVNAVKPDQLPESFRVKLNDPEQYEEIYDQYKDTRGRRRDRRPESTAGARSSTSSSAIQNIALVVAVVMAIAALLLVANTIQVAAYSKRREVAVMKLVGASNWFIQAPFVLEAVVAGLIGSTARSGAPWSRRSICSLDGALSALRVCSRRSPGATSCSDLPVDGRRRWPGQRGHRLDHPALLPAGLGTVRVVAVGSSRAPSRSRK